MNKRDFDMSGKVNGTHLESLRPKRLFTPEEYPVIAIDLDDTIWNEDSFPEPGTPYPYCIYTINKMLEEGYDVILWTSRGGDSLDKSVSHLQKCGLVITHDNFYVNNHSIYYTDRYPVQSPKVSASMYIDNKAYKAPDFKHYWRTLYGEFIGGDPMVDFLKERKDS